MRRIGIDIVQIAEEFQLSAFDCGVSSLNEYLRRFALSEAKSSPVRTYTAIRNGSVAGFYTLAAGVVLPELRSGKASNIKDTEALPIALLSRLAVDSKEQGQGIGASLLLHALTVSSVAGDFIGARAVLAFAQHEKSRAFYGVFGFKPVPGLPYHVFLSLKDILKTLSCFGELRA